MKMPSDPERFVAPRAPQDPWDEPPEDDLDGVDDDLDRLYGFTRERYETPRGGSGDDFDDFDN